MNKARRPLVCELFFCGLTCVGKPPQALLRPNTNSLGGENPAPTNKSTLARFQFQFRNKPDVQQAVGAIRAECPDDTVFEQMHSELVALTAVAATDLSRPFVSGGTEGVDPVASILSWSKTLRSKGGDFFGVFAVPDS